MDRRQIFLLATLALGGAGGLRWPHRSFSRSRPVSLRRLAFNYDPWSLSMGRNASLSLPASLEPVLFPVFDERRVESPSPLDGGFPPVDGRGPLLPDEESGGQDLEDRSATRKELVKRAPPMVPRSDIEGGQNRSASFPRGGQVGLKEAMRLQRTNEQLRARLAYLESRISMLENQLKVQRISRAKLSGGELDDESKELALLVAPGLPEQEQLLLGCTAAGALVGLMVGNVLQHTVLWMRYIGGSGFVGAIVGAVLAVYYSNRDDGPGNLSRAAGKLVVLGTIRSIALASDVVIVMRLLWQRLALVEKIRRAGYALQQKLTGLRLPRWRSQRQQQQQQSAEKWRIVKLFRRRGAQEKETGGEAHDPQTKISPEKRNGFTGVDSILSIMIPKSDESTDENAAHATAGQVSAAPLPSTSSTSLNATAAHGSSRSRQQRWWWPFHGKG